MKISLSYFLKNNAWAIDSMMALLARGKISQKEVTEFIENGCSNFIDTHSMSREFTSLLDDNTQFDLYDLVNENSIDSVVFAMKSLPEYSDIWCKFAVWCAQQVCFSSADFCDKSIESNYSNHADAVNSASRRAICATTSKDNDRIVDYVGMIVDACSFANIYFKKEAVEKLKKITKAEKWID